MPKSRSIAHVNYAVATFRPDALFLAALTGASRDLDRLLAVFAPALRLVFLTFVLPLPFVRLAFPVLVLVLAFRAMGLMLLALFRVLAALLTERRNAGFSRVVTGAAVAVDPGRARLRPSPIFLANWDRCSE